MDQHNPILTPSQKEPVPQLQIRTDLSAGASLQSCLDNLAYWQKQYTKMCGTAAPVATPY
jgi:hypothetical protein